MLNLHNVTLTITETRCHKLAQLALIDCLSHARFGEVIVCSNRFKEFEFLDGQSHFVLVDDWPTKREVQEFTHHQLPKFIKTDYALCFEWDSWIIDPKMWTDEFLQYDFIGAPWGFPDGLNVGNGGFSLRSTKLMRYVADYKDQFPMNDKADALLCRHYRSELERAGFKWAPKPLAARFSTERHSGTANVDSFGFHGTFLFPYVLAANDEAYIERKLLMQANPYVSNTEMMAEMELVERGYVPFSQIPEAA